MTSKTAEVIWFLLVLSWAVDVIHPWPNIAVKEFWKSIRWSYHHEFSV